MYPGGLAGSIRSGIVFPRKVMPPDKPPDTTAVPRLFFPRLFLEQVQGGRKCPKAALSAGTAAAPGLVLREGDLKRARDEVRGGAGRHQVARGQQKLLGAPLRELVARAEGSREALRAAAHLGDPPDLRELVALLEHRCAADRLLPQQLEGAPFDGVDHAWSGVGLGEVASRASRSLLLLPRAPFLPRLLLLLLLPSHRDDPSAPPPGDPDEAHGHLVERLSRLHLPLHVCLRLSSRARGE
mmetsp:Transcript_10957/g.26885  ORF Transcript_10957/g.26885 Transcript_10957/m.26885 type:complete len:241 (-) Transcript_10957:55-777(-)